MSGDVAATSENASGHYRTAAFVLLALGVLGVALGLLAWLGGVAPRYASPPGLIGTGLVLLITGLSLRRAASRLT